MTKFSFLGDLFNKITYLVSVFPVVTSRKPNHIRHLQLLPSDPLPDGTMKAPRWHRSPKTTRGSISTWKLSTRADSLPVSCRRGVRLAPPLHWALGLGVYWRECVKTEGPFSSPPPQWAPRALPEMASWKNSRRKLRKFVGIWKQLWLVGRSFRLHWLKNERLPPRWPQQLRPQSQPPFAPPSPKSQQIWKGDAHNVWNEHDDSGHDFLSFSSKKTFHIHQDSFKIIMLRGH